MYFPNNKAISALAAVLSEAFFDYPTYKYSLPDSKSRKRKLLTLFKILVKYSMKYGKVISTSKDNEGLMLLLPPNTKISNWGMIKCGALKIPIKIGFDFIRRQEKIDKIQEKLRQKYAKFPHMYLWAVAVRPELQNKGYGKKLISYLQEELKKEKIQCYLETAKNLNVKIYKKFGFELLEKAYDKEIDRYCFPMLWKPDSIE